jgi:hypothetical protein
MSKHKQKSRLKKRIQKKILIDVTWTIWVEQRLITNFHDFQPAVEHKF